ncbi:MAG: hypothetical protein GEU95_14480 [Rhizobiales bacterium]|nr:hypothetical protein [Hyphomicrobiales bacterium]
MSLRQPWFLVMAPKAANRFGSHWVGYRAPPCGDVIGRLVTPENRRALAAFAIIWLIATLLIWLWSVTTGMFSPAFAIMATVLIAGVMVASFIRLVCVQMADHVRRDQVRRVRRTGQSR